MEKVEKESDESEENIRTEEKYFRKRVLRKISMTGLGTQRCPGES